MIVTCPNCDTRYNLPDAKVPAGGAKVKCSKCAQVFKAEPPPASPEEEVEALLEEENLGADTQAGEDFDETFDDVAGASDGPTEAVGEKIEEAVGEADMPDTDDLFEEEDQAAPEESAPDIDDDDLFADDDDSADIGDLFADEDDLDDDTADTQDMFEEDLDFVPAEDADQGDDEVGGIFSDEDDEIDEDEDEEPVEGGVEDDLSLDDEPVKGGRKSLGCLILLLVLALALGAGVYFKVWTYAGIDLGDMLKNVPFVGQLFMEETGGDQEPAPGESPAERVRKIELKNVKQYYVPNEKVGNLFVVEGKAVNKFSKPKEQIKVEVILYDATNNVLTSQAFLCGNVLSQFQLQVQTEKEIKDGLGSEVGVLSNNTFIRPGASTPFMAVFFQPPSEVKEFMVKVVDVGDPE